MGSFKGEVRTSFLSRVIRITEDVNREILGTSKITHKFQVTVPKEVRKRFDFEKGETLVFLDENNNLIVKKSTDV